MRMKNDNKIKYKFCVLGIVAMLALSACGSAADQTPTPGLEAIYTAAAQTIAAQQATLQAQVPPTVTPSATLFPTLPPPTAQSSLLNAASPTSSTGGAVGCDNSVYINDVTIPDGTVMTPGQTFTKTWLVLNNGTCAWNTTYKFNFISGEAMGSSSVAVPSAVPAGQQVQLSVDLTAPTTAGDYTGWWKLQNDKGEYFGNGYSVVIKVSGATATSTAPTNTPATATNTSETPTATKSP